MPYSVGAKGTHGCAGYPVIKTSTGEVIACHATRANAEDQIIAIGISEAQKADSSILPAQPSSTANSTYPGVGIKRPSQGRSTDTTSGYVRSSYAKKPKVRGGRSGDAQNSTGSIGSGGSGGSMGVSKANDLYSPPESARAAARKAIKFKEDGKANGAGTAVGWTRASQLAGGESVSLETVKRMYSYFSRHEVDKKGKDWANQSNPSNGYIMWLAWGGDAGFAWSRSIVQREAKKFWQGTAFEQR